MSNFYPYYYRQMQTEHLILSVETSGRLGSVALSAGSTLLAETGFSAPMRHSAEIFPAANDLLERFDKKPDEIAQIYISVGPGSFTGLRIAVTMAKMMAIANDVKIVAVDTLDVIAANAIEYIEKEKKPIETIAVILDAKRSQFFVAVYEKQNQKWEKTVDDCLMTVEQFHQWAGCKGVWLTGEGLMYYKESFKAETSEFFDETLWNPKASKVYMLGLPKAQAGNLADPVTLVPKYIQRPDIGMKKI